MQSAMALFLARLMMGVGWFGWAFSKDELKVVSPFFRILMLILLGLGVTFGLAAPREGAWGAMLIVPALAFVGSVVWFLERRSAGRVLFLACAVFTQIWIGSQVVRTSDGAGSLLNVCSQLASTATLTAALCGMLLGHRYLTAPGMPLGPLIEANFLLGLAGLLRLVVSGAALAYGASALSGTTTVVWLALRWFAGIGGPIVCWWLVRRILVYRNTQAATGVLFVAVILTFIGELTGEILFRSLGVPF
jgi:hypothetical protein